MKKYNLFIVRSPLQFINAMEAKYHFKTENNILCLIHNKSKINSSQMNKLLSFTNWDEIVELNKENKKSSLLSNIKLIKSLYKKTYKYLFSGHLGNINIALISSLKKEQTFLIDDGTATINLHQTVLNPNTEKKQTLNSLLRSYRYNLFGHKCTLKNEKIDYFTFFDITPYNNENVIKNSFSFLKNTFMKELQKDENTVYLLGQNLVEIGAIQENTYLEYLKKIIAFYDAKKIVYYPHRAEEVTQNYNTLINENFIVKKATQPIEIELLTTGVYPSCITSFISSALFSLHKIFSDSDINSFVIDEKDLIKHQKTISMIYENQDKAINKIYFKENQFE